MFTSEFHHFDLLSQFYFKISQIEDFCLGLGIDFGQNLKMTKTS